MNTHAIRRELMLHLPVEEVALRSDDECYVLFRAAFDEHNFASDDRYTSTETTALMVCAAVGAALLVYMLVR